MISFRLQPIILRAATLGVAFVACFAHAQSASAPTSAPAAVPASAPVSAAKHALVQRILASQQPGIESMARSLAEQSVAPMLQAAGRALQSQVAANQQAAVAKAIDGDVKKYLSEAVPVIRDRALKIAPSTLGVAFEEKFSEDELRQLADWLDSPVNKKFVQLGAEIQSGFTQQLVADTRSTVEPKMQSLEEAVAKRLGLPSGPAGASGGASGPRAPSAAASAARKK